MSEDAGRENLRLVGKVLAVSGVTLIVGAAVTALGLLPLSRPAAKAATIVLVVTAAVDLIAAMYFVLRTRR